MVMNNNYSLAGSYYGAPQQDYRLSAVAGASLAAASAPYVGRGDKCSGNDDTCGANKVRGQEFCAGHMKKAKAEAEKAVE